MSFFGSLGVAAADPLDLPAPVSMHGHKRKAPPGENWRGLRIARRRWECRQGLGRMYVPLLVRLLSNVVTQPREQVCMNRVYSR